MQNRRKTGGYRIQGVAGTEDTRNTCTVSQYFVLLQYTAVFCDLGDTGVIGVRRDMI